MVEAKRKLANWMDAWEDYTEALPSPTLWRRWGGIGILAAALERKVWVRTGMGNLYPNLYIIICGPPGLGKTAVTSQVGQFLGDLSDGTNKGLHLASSSITFASMIDELVDAKREVVKLDMNPNLYEFNSLSIVSNELGVLLPEYDVFMMPKLTDLYDGHPYSESRRSREKKEKIVAPQINLIASCTPAYLTEVLPPGAWDQGFLSRTLVAFSTENLQREIFTGIKLQTNQRADLAHDLAMIFKSDHTFGPMLFTPEAQAELEAWHKGGDQPKPDHPKLMHYTTRRVAHLLKLCMIASIAESSARVITHDHLQTALGWLLELEIFLPDIFKAMVIGGDGQAMQEAWYHFASEYAKNPHPISEQRVIAYLMQRIPGHSVVRVLDVMVRAGLFAEVFLGGSKGYKPLARKSV